MNLFAPNHLILIAIIVLLLFGGKKLPGLMRSLGRSRRDFNDAKNNTRRDVDETVRAGKRPANTPAIRM